jgi:CO/xanthine dehydrogenase Mo-binding subunit
VLFEEVEMTRDEAGTTLVGKSIPQPDSMEKAVGGTLFSDDIRLPGMLWGMALRSPFSNAHIRRLDVRDAKRLPGVLAVITAADIPGVNLRGNIPGFRDDQPVLVEDRARAVGDPVALVAAESMELADEAVSSIKVEYEQRTPLEDPLASLEPGAPLIDERGNIISDLGYSRGDPDQGFEMAAAIVEETFRTQFAEHAYLEPESGVAWLDPGDVVHIRCGTQWVENFRHIARILGVPHNQVRVESPLVGGGFGGKIFMTIEPLLALLVKETGRPVRMALTREESILSSTKRHPFILRYRIGADARGRLTALVADLVADVGAYTDASGVIGWYSLGLLAGPYRCSNVKVNSRFVLTNNPTGTAMRGVGSAQITFALEGAMELLAGKIGIEPFELRKRNYLSKGESLPTGQPLKNAVLLAETWEAADKALDNVLSKNNEKLSKLSPKLRRARGHTSDITGYGRRHGHLSQAQIAMQLDGSAVVSVGVADIGSGQRLGCQQVAAEILGLPLDKVTLCTSDSQMNPIASMTAGSRTFLNAAGAVLCAAEPIAKAFKNAAAELLEARSEDIVLADGKAFVKGSLEPNVPHAQLVAAAAAAGTSLTNLGSLIIDEDPYPGEETAHNTGWLDYTFGGMAAEVAVDPETGEVTILGLGLSHDVGTAVNPQIVTRQCEGGIVQGMGLALLEDCCVKGGRSEAHDFATYLIPTSMDIPSIDIEILESGEGEGPFGARGIGEPPHNITPSAIANAVSRAIGTQVTSLPITPEKVLIALRTGEWPR